MKTGAVVAVALAVAAGIGLTSVFVGGASPYVTIAESEGKSETVHVVGKIVPGTLEQNTLARRVDFDLTDATSRMHVRYTGPALSNLASANQVVVIGSHKDGKFEAKQMLVKCPSKYESENSAKG